MNSLCFSRTPEGPFKLETELRLPRRRDNVFPFFADTFNLEILTPPWLKFTNRGRKGWGEGGPMLLPHRLNDPAGA